MSDDNLPDKLRSLCGVVDPYAECRNRSDYRCPVCRAADELERLHGLLQPCRADTDAQIDPDYPRTVDDVLSLLSAYISDFMPEDVCPPDEYYAAWERQARTVVEPMMQRLAAAELERERLQGDVKDRNEAIAVLQDVVDKLRAENEQIPVLTQAVAEALASYGKCRRLLRSALRTSGCREVMGSTDYEAARAAAGGEG